MVKAEWGVVEFFKCSDQSIELCRAGVVSVSE